MDPSNYGYRKIGGIPTVVTSDHHYVLMHWNASGLRDADLLHIDGHHDMVDAVQDRLMFGLENIYDPKLKMIG